MKKATITLLWVAFCFAVVAVCINVYDLVTLDYTTDNMQSLATGMSAVNVVVCVFTWYFAISTISIVRNAKTVADIPVWRKYVPFLLNIPAIVVGILLLCLRDEHLVEPVPQAPVVQQRTPTDAYTALAKYKFMLDEGLISQEDYEAKKKELLK